jgi:hypothetical protein
MAGGRANLLSAMPIVKAARQSPMHIHDVGVDSAGYLIHCHAPS